MLSRNQSISLRNSSDPVPVTSPSTFPLSSVITAHVSRFKSVGSFVLDPQEVNVNKANTASIVTIFFITRKNYHIKYLYEIPLYCIEIFKKANFFIKKSLF
ncbi:MAG: hypothetical protein LBF15_02290 [Candidatus Peribacteria bacterium]|jgi:hypothetical protein|nr:hypothetical protein [Candidatus Peribacteria bacterium]